MAPHRSTQQRRTVTTHTTTTTTTARNELTEHEESEDEVQAVQVRPSSHKHSSSRRQASSQQPVEEARTSSRRERSEVHGQRHRERTTRTQPNVDQSQVTSSRREVRRTERHEEQTQIGHSRRATAQEDRQRVQSQRETRRGEISRSDRHGEQNRDRRRETRRREGGGRHRSHSETTQSTTTVRRRIRNQNQTAEQRFRAEKQLAEEHQLQHPEQFQAHHQHAEHDHATSRSNARVNTTTLTTFNALQESFANGDREEYGDQHQWQELQHRLQLRSQDESLEPSYWQASQQFHFEWMELDPDWESPPGNAYEWYFEELNIWDAEDYPPIPYEAGKSIAREMAISQGMVEQHDYMIMALLAGEMSPCPASLSWFVTDIGYICQGYGHFLPHSEIDMILAGARPNGPYLWDRNFLTWAESDNWYNTEFYGQARAFWAAFRASQVR